MIFCSLPDDAIQDIFLYINDYCHIRILQCSCSFFTKDFSKDYINKYLRERKKFILNYFPRPIIDMLGGYDQILHYPIIENPTIRVKSLESKDILNIKFDRIIPAPNFSEMVYPVMIGVYNNEAFISLIIETHSVLEEKWPDIHELKLKMCSAFKSGYHILTIYSCKSRGISDSHPPWITSNNYLYCVIKYSDSEKRYKIIHRDLYRKIKDLLQSVRRSAIYNKLVNHGVDPSNLSQARLDRFERQHFQKQTGSSIPPWAALMAVKVLPWRRGMEIIF